MPSAHTYALTALVVARASLEIQIEKGAIGRDEAADALEAVLNFGGPLLGSEGEATREIVREMIEQYRRTAT